MSVRVLNFTWPPSTSHNIVESPMELILGIIEYALTHKLREFGTKTSASGGRVLLPLSDEVIFVFFGFLKILQL